MLGNESNSTVQHSAQLQNIIRDRRPDRAVLPPLQTPGHFNNMGITLPNARHANYQHNFVARQPHVIAGEGIHSQRHTSAQVAFINLPPAQGVVPTQYYRQQPQHYQQGHQMAGFQRHYTGGPIAYSHPPGYAHPYPHAMQQMPVQPAAYGHASTGYYPVPHFATPMYDHPSVSFRGEQTFPTQSPTPGGPATHGSVVAGPAASALPQIVSTRKSSPPLVLTGLHFD
jgi:hypothetical protein